MAAAIIIGISVAKIRVAKRLSGHGFEKFGKGALPYRIGLDED